ncbi:hypothetical protein FB639_005824, partial [Coemansia asiatica]
GQDDDLLKYSPAYTGSSYENALRSKWVSVYYQVNNNINLVDKKANPEQYSSVTWLYGTTQLPPAYEATWGPGYQARAKEAFEKTASTKHSQTSSKTSSEASSETDSHSESETDSKTSSASKAFYSLSTVTLGVFGTVVAA